MLAWQASSCADHSVKLRFFSIDFCVAVLVHHWKTLGFEVLSICWYMNCKSCTLLGKIEKKLPTLQYSAAVVLTRLIDLMNRAKNKLTASITL